MDEILLSVNDVLQNILTELTSDSSKYLSRAKLIAGLGASIFAVSTFHKIMNGNSDEAIEHFVRKIFLVLLGISYYGAFISFINTPLNIMSNSIKNEMIVENAETRSFFNSLSERATKEKFTNNQESDNAINDILNQADNGLGTDQEVEEESSTFMSFWRGDYKNQIRNWILEAEYSLIHYLGVAAIVILNVVRTFFLIVLTIFGIFVIAISIYPGLENSFTQWLQKYINVYLWLPISYILEGLISKIFTLITVDDNSGFWEISSQTGSDLVNNMVLGLIGLCSLVAFAAVPTLSSWLINAATSSAGSKVKQKAMMAGKKVMPTKK